MFQSSSPVDFSASTSGLVDMKYELTLTTCCDASASDSRTRYVIGSDSSFGNVYATLIASAATAHVSRCSCSSLASRSYTCVVTARFSNGFSVSFATTIDWLSYEYNTCNGSHAILVAKYAPPG